VREDRSKAHHAGLMAHEAAMRPIREQQTKQRQAAQNISGANEHQQYRQNSEKLFQSAMQGAADSSDYYRTGAADERKDEKLRNLNNIEVRHPQLSDEAKKHLGALTDFSRAAIHTGVWGGLQSAGKEFSKDAMEHWNKTFTGMRPHEANINHPLDIIPSLLKPEHLSSVLKRYSSHDLSGRSQHTSMPQSLTHLDQRPRLPINTGENATWGLRTTIPDGHHTFHNSVHHLGIIGTSLEFKNTEGGLDIRDSIRSHITGSLIPLHMGGESPFKTTDNHWEKQVAYTGEQKHSANFRKAVGAGLKHIWSIPNISDHDRDLLHRHFESQLRHHYVAAVANPRMFNQYHESMETARREREQAKREEQQRQRQSSSGSSSGGSSGGRSRRGEWPHSEQPHELLGVAHNAGPDEIRRAYKKLTVTEHPDQIAPPQPDDMAWKTIDPEGHASHHAELKQLVAQSKKLRELSNTGSDFKERDEAAKKRIETIEKIEELNKTGELTRQRHIESPAGQEIIKKHEQAKKVATDHFAKINDAYEHMMKKHGLNEWVVMLAEWVSKRYKK
jgi:DnaJ-domain-containing protein 1